MDGTYGRPTPPRQRSPHVRRVDPRAETWHATPAARLALIPSWRTRHTCMCASERKPTAGLGGHLSRVDWLFRFALVRLVIATPVAAAARGQAACNGAVRQQVRA